MTPSQRRLLESLYKTTNQHQPKASVSKMMDLVTKSKASLTLASYHSLIKRWNKFCNNNDYSPCPAQSQHLAEFISSLALAAESLAVFQKILPALKFLHDANRIQEPLAIDDPFVKLILEGAKREAAARKSRTKKAPSFSQQDIHKIIDSTIWKQGVGTIGPKPDLVLWRTVVRVFTYYKTFCRFNCYQQLSASDVTFYPDHICIEFKKAKNDQFYNGTFSLLSALPNSPYCPKLIYSSFFKVMGFLGTSSEFLNCRILTSKNISRSKPTEKLCYSNSIRDTKNMLQSIGFEGNFSSKSFKVAWVSKAIEEGVTLLDIQTHGRWRNLETPLIYTQKSKQRRLEVSKHVT